MESQHNSISKSSLSGSTLNNNSNIFAHNNNAVFTPSSSSGGVVWGKSSTHSLSNNSIGSSSYTTTESSNSSNNSSNSKPLHHGPPKTWVLSRFPSSLLDNEDNEQEEDRYSAQSTAHRCLAVPVSSSMFSDAASIVVYRSASDLYEPISADCTNDNGRTRSSSGTMGASISSLVGHAVRRMSRDRRDSFNISNVNGIDGSVHNSVESRRKGSITIQQQKDEEDPMWEQYKKANRGPVIELSSNTSGNSSGSFK